MLFMSFQPMNVRDILKEVDYTNKGINSPSQYSAANRILGYNPIFTIPILNEQDLMLRLNICCPTAPQTCIIFESDEYDTIEYYPWLRHAIYSERLGRKNFNSENRHYKEFMVRKISKLKIREILDISTVNFDELNSHGVSKLQDISLDYIASNSFKNIIIQYIDIKSKSLSALGNKKCIGNKNFSLLYLLINQANVGKCNTMEGELTSFDELLKKFSRYINS